MTGTMRLPISGRADRLAAAAVWTTSALVAAVFVWIAADVATRGLAHLSWSFVVDAPRDAGRSGGIFPILVSTALILGVCLAVAVPLGVGTAVLLAEYTRQAGPFSRVVRGSLEVLAGMPSIVFGLFGNALFTVVLGLGFSILSGGVTLACMVLPILVRTLEEGLRAVPDEYRRAAAALGLSQATILWRLILPAAAPALVVGLVLGIGRALAETAALLFTSGYVDRLPGSLLDSGRTLSIHVYDLAMNVPGGEAAAAASALVLVALLLAINVVTTWIGHRWLHGRLLSA
ncbi:MAG: phosphate ABC transporter permease PstA [Vicinamibacterales bacterium]|nr:phosphate ABC transporter permease PstA [Vicinamibacterales bacterium]